MHSFCPPLLDGYVQFRLKANACGTVYKVNNCDAIEGPCNRLCSTGNSRHVFCVSDGGEIPVVTELLLVLCGVVGVGSDDVRSDAYVDNLFYGRRQSGRDP